MLTKTKIALAAALVLGGASVALADSDFDPNLGNRYPAYNGPTAVQGTTLSARVRHNGRLRSAPVRLQNGESFSYGAARLPRAFSGQEQTGYPQSPAGFGGF